MMRLVNFYQSRFVADKKVLVLGHEGVGKHSLVNFYKDGVFYPEQFTPSNKNINYIKTVDNKKTSIEFILDESPSTLSAIFKHKKRDYDLILILVDLTSEKFQEDIKLHKEYAERQYPTINIMVVGTKKDLIESSTHGFDDEIILTSSKTGEGFDAFDKTFMDSFLAQSKNFKPI